MSMRGLRSCLLLVLAFDAASAVACGVCIEDRVAVVYDHAVVARAHARKHAVAFFALDATAPLAKDSQRRFINLAESAGGVDKGSARVSLEPVSLAVAFDAKRVPLSQLEKELERKFAARNVALRFLQVLDPSSQAIEARKQVSVTNAD
jgi:hypothetical protein